MKDQEIKDMFRNIKTIAIIGITPKEDRPSYIVASYLKSKGYQIIPVRPDGEEILGEKVYHSLSEIPEEIGVDAVDIFRRSEDVPPLVEEAISGATISAALNKQPRRMCISVGQPLACFPHTAACTGTRLTACPGFSMKKPWRSCRSSSNSNAV